MNLDAQTPIVRELTADDLAIQHLVLDEGELRARVVDLEADRDTYCELLLAALAELHAVTRQTERRNDAHRRLVAEARELRQALMASDGIYPERAA